MARFCRSRADVTRDHQEAPNLRPIAQTPSPHFSHRLVARRRRVAWMQGAPRFGEEGIVVTMSRSRRGAQRSRQAALRLRSRDGVKNAGQPAFLTPSRREEKESGVVARHEHRRRGKSSDYVVGEIRSRSDPNPQAVPCCSECATAPKSRERPGRRPPASGSRGASGASELRPPEASARKR